MKSILGGMLVLMFWIVSTFGSVAVYHHSLKERPAELHQVAHRAKLTMILLNIISLLLGAMLQAHWNIIRLTDE